MQQAPPFKGTQQRAQIGGSALQRPGVLREREVLDVLVRVIQHRVVVGADVAEGGVDRADALTDGTGELPGRVAGGLGGLGVDDVGHGLGGAELHAAVEKGALGELPGPGLPGAEGEELLQQRAQHHGRAVALEFRGVLAGIAVGAAADRAQAEIQQRPVPPAQLTVDEFPVLPRGHGAAGERMKQPVGQRYGFRPGQPDDADGGQLRAGGDGGNGIRHGFLLKKSI